MTESQHKIHVLPEELCNKIAAGEVVERPSSVVKELLENSLDAGASDILVELQSGGKRLIRIADNGSGMHRQDAFLSLERHATSKISSDEDLFALQTLGFRGEALASIASVSRFLLQTCANEDGLGQQIYAEGGAIKRAEEVGLPQGTVIEVRNLFFNLPARRKFLRKEQTELSHVADVVTKQALANPAVSFRMKNNERMLLDLRREKGLRERFAAVLGRSLLKDMLEVEQQGGPDLRLTGLISQPQLNRSAASHIYTFINGRYIRDRVVQHAVMEGYRHLLMKGRYPVVALFLELDPALVDVNVHPTKHEVRFRDQGLVHDFIANALQQTLRPSDWLTDRDEDDVAQTASVMPTPVAPSEYRPATLGAPSQMREAAASYQPVSSTVSHPEPVPVSQAERLQQQPQPVEQLVLPASEPHGFFSGLKILGQYHQSYLLCQDGDDLILIDQHAAHERIGFEKLRASYAEGLVPSQSLLFPEMLELDFRSATALEESAEELEKLGFDIEPFGGKSFALKAVPQVLAGRDVGRLVIDVALELEKVGRAGQLQESIDEILILMACHGVIRANQALTTEEIKALLRELDRIDFKAHCPHGRPVMQRLTLTEVERLFKRQ
ncbi:DNA mismatch repair protein MutL [Malonomonas rubra DSM 5091]|uniref:DNA mismatch repair protein MutL n=1 Tax=Malonomonas rubra DSM 5091 TaxID=1122189 RepID=A0A1M6DLS8_MALRU|nr:DNA mismatch repair endonuclease MutL [Malonomonas rubra]SHI74019.1 DNA mismatch repair protein MutL [Malonomonas rubra DSM 5091]